MQGINKTKHANLVDALLLMEELLGNGQENSAGQEQADFYKRELETMYRKYEKLLNELSNQLIAYDILYSEVKVKFLGRKLKALKKGPPMKKTVALVLHESIRLVYGT